jgi:hypothetical protein
MIQGFKSLATRQYIAGVNDLGWARFDGKLWQRDYFDHVIRNDRALEAIREYIYTNPQRWELDAENPTGDATDDVEMFIRSLEQRDKPLRGTRDAGVAPTGEGHP